MPNNSIVIHDTVYEMTNAYRRGAQAFRDNVSNSCNPYRPHSQSHDEWDYGHVLESAGEHFRGGEDILAAKRDGRRIAMDSSVPRDTHGDVNDEWHHQERKRLLQKSVNAA